MNRRILIQVTAPAVLIGSLLLIVGLVSAFYVDRLQKNLTDLLAHNLSSLKTAQELENSVRQLRFHCFLYFIDPDPTLIADIDKDEQTFEQWLSQAGEIAATAEEKTAVLTIKKGYNQYQRELVKLRKEVERSGPRSDVRKVVAAHPARHVTNSCRQYAQLIEEMSTRTSEESKRLSQWVHLTMLLLGLGGPLAGLLAGYGIARALSRSLYRLSVRVQDMAQHLEEDVAAVKLTPDGDLQKLDNQLQHVVGRVAEVTEKLQRQGRDMLRAQQLAAVGQLAASVAHEVRNPLTSIKMLVEAAMRSHRPKPFTAENLQVVHGEILRLEQTVQSFLDFARPPALQRRECDLRAVIAQTTELIRARARQQKVLVEVHCPSEPVPATVDSSQLCTVLVNLLINGLDAMAGGGRLKVTLESSPTTGIRLCVQDTGDGISAKMIDKLFTPFSSTKPTGSGLGLSICKRIIEEHDGTITAMNRPEGGACFTVTLPQTIHEAAYADTLSHR